MFEPELNYKERQVGDTIQISQKELDSCVWRFQPVQGIVTENSSIFFSITTNRTKPKDMGKNQNFDSKFFTQTSRMVLFEKTLHYFKK